MKKLFTILSLALGLSLFAATIVAQNQKDFEVTVEDTEEKKTRDRDAQIVVTGTGTKKLLKSAPVKTELITRKDIENKGSTTLFESLAGESGLNPDNACLNCGLNEVGINGLPGKYTQILFDSVPSVSSLTSVYFLQQFPTELIERIEVVKGGASALYGSGAAGGVINIITRKPITNEANITYKHEFVGLGTNPSFAFSVNGFASAVTNDGQAGIAVFGSKTMRDPYDRNNDGWSEIAKMDNTSYGFNAYWSPISTMEIDVSYSGISEFRRGGDMDMRKDPHNSSIAEQADSQLNTVVTSLNHEILTSKTLNIDYKVYFGYSNMARHTYYGGLNTGEDFTDSAKLYGYTTSDYFSGGFQSNFNFFEMHTVSAGYGFTGELVKDTNKSADVKQDTTRYTDNHGGFVQYNLDLDVFEAVAGIRMDKNSELVNPIFSPRISMIGHFFDHRLHWRVSYAMGFNAPQVFDEDYHIDVSMDAGSSYKNVMKNSPGLKEETTHTVSTDISGDFDIGTVGIDFGVGFFWTRLINAMETESGAVVGGVREWTRSNVDGYGDIMGSNLELGFQFTSWLRFSNGITYLFIKNYYDNNGNEKDMPWGTSDMLRQPVITGFSQVDFFYDRFSANVNVQYIGPMVLANEDQDERFTTPFFPVLNVRLNYRFTLSQGLDMDIFVGADNIIDVFMADKYMGDVNAGERDAGVIHGPSKPFTVYAGAKLSL